MACMAPISSLRIHCCIPCTARRASWSASIVSLPIRLSARTNPTTTSFLDIIGCAQYAAPPYPPQHQEAEDVTSVSDRERGLFHPHVCCGRPRCRRLRGGPVGVPIGLSRLFCPP